jgi:hypothetical protein
VSLPWSRELSEARTSLVCKPSISPLIRACSASFAALSGLPEPGAAVPLMSVLEATGDEGTVLVGVTLALLTVPLAGVDLDFGPGILAEQEMTGGMNGKT